MAIYRFLESESEVRHTKIFWDFCDEIEVQFRIIYLLITFAQEKDHMQFLARKTLIELGEIPFEKADEETADESPDESKILKGPATKAFIKVTSDLYRNMFVRIMENFETYLADILAEIYIEKPEMLKSKETLTLDEVLRFECRDDLIKYISEKRVNNLQMQGLKAIRKHVAEQHGLNWFTDEDETFLDRAMLTRNVIVHNKSRVNHIYLKKYPDCGHELGHKLKVKAYAESMVPRILEIASKLDLITAEKFEFEIYKQKSKESIS
jgi:hypothetical protein